jgi:hypothetical protein
MAQERTALVRLFWEYLGHKHWDELGNLFHPECKILWPNTAEEFTPERYVTMNQEYPGNWRIDIEDVIEADQKVISVVRIVDMDAEQSLRGIAFFHIENGLIRHLREYFAEDVSKPDWRK